MTTIFRSARVFGRSSAAPAIARTMPATAAVARFIRTNPEYCPAVQRIRGESARRAGLYPW
jgi:hypothetical protein